MDLTKEEALSLAIVGVYVDTSVLAGKASSSGTPNLWNNSVVRGDQGDDHVQIRRLSM